MTKSPFYCFTDWGVFGGDVKEPEFDVSHQKAAFPQFCPQPKTLETLQIQTTGVNFRDKCDRSKQRAALFEALNVLW